MKKSLILAVFSILALTLSASAQSATGALTVTATVNGSLKLVFDSVPSTGVALDTEGSSTATLDFGTVSAFMNSTSTITVTPNTAASKFTVSTPVNFKVYSANTSSANYKLMAQLNAADAVNSWAVNGQAVTNAAASQVSASSSYNTDVPFPVAITVPFSNTTGSVSNTINFTATAN